MRQERKNLSGGLVRMVNKKLNVEVKQNRSAMPITLVSYLLFIGSVSFGIWNIGYFPTSLAKGVSLLISTFLVIWFGITLIISIQADSERRILLAIKEWHK